MSTKEYSMIDVAPTVCAALQLPAPRQAKGASIREVVTDLADVDRVAVLALDALGMFAWNLWKAEMPYLSSLRARNSITLRSVMPSITPVNFATMVTGTDLAGHGIQAKQDDFACETLFDVVREAKGKSAGVGLDGYSARPEFLIAQFGKVDDVFHQHGPSNPLVVPMLKGTDTRLVRLVEHLKPLGYGIVILADHGQHDVTEFAHEGILGIHGTDSPEDCLVPCTWL